MFKNIADKIVEEGYKDVGYEYVIIDDCWLEFDRDNETNKLVPDKKRFPNGMKAVADYVSLIKFYKQHNSKIQNKNQDSQQRSKIRTLRRLWNEDMCRISWSNRSYAIRCSNFCGVGS